MIGVGPTPWSLLIEGPVKLSSGLLHVDTQHEQVVRMFMRRVGAAAIHGFMDGNRGDDRPSFEIPAEARVVPAAGTDALQAAVSVDRAG